MDGLNWKWIFSVLKSENNRAENNLEDTIVAYVIPEKTRASDKQKISYNYFWPQIMIVLHSMKVQQNRLPVLKRYQREFNKKKDN